jgi:hypothetical protein
MLRVKRLPLVAFYLGDAQRAFRLASSFTTTYHMYIVPTLGSLIEQEGSQLCTVGPSQFLQCSKKKTSWTCPSCALPYSAFCISLISRTLPFHSSDLFDADEWEPQKGKNARNRQQVGRATSVIDPAAIPNGTGGAGRIQSRNR